MAKKTCDKAYFDKKIEEIDLKIINCKKELNRLREAKQLMKRRFATEFCSHDGRLIETFENYGAGAEECYECSICGGGTARTSIKTGFNFSELYRSRNPDRWLPPKGL